MIAVFDTNIVIDALNGVTDSDAEYRRYTRLSHATRKISVRTKRGFASPID